MKNCRLLDISEVSKQSGFPASTLRFYEEKGLIQSISRSGLKRVFDPYILEQLNFIALGQQAGFSLDDIKSMFMVNGNFEVNRTMLRHKAEEITQHIKQLTAIRDSLIHAANCKEDQHMNCPKFRALLKKAGKNMLQKKRTDQS